MWFVLKNNGRNFSVKDLIGRSWIEKQSTNQPKKPQTYVIQPWYRLLQPFKRRRNKSLWVCIENVCSEITQNQIFISYLLLCWAAWGNWVFMVQLRMLLVTGTHSIVPVEPSPIPVSPPLLAVSKKCQGVIEAKTARDGSDQQGTELSAVSPCGSYPTGGNSRGFTQTRCLWASRELQLKPGSSTKPWVGKIQFPCLGYVVPQNPHAENPHPDLKGISRNFALTRTIIQLHSVYTQEFCSGINYNTSTAIWSKSGLACTLWCHSTGSNLEIQTQPSSSRVWGANQGEILQCMQHSCINHWKL